MNESSKGRNFIFEELHQNYLDLNQKMVREIDISSVHGTLTGNYREETWLSFFRSMIPMKYTMASGVIIMDSYGNVSNEVDIAVYDEQYTPYVFRYNNLKIIPIEAVAVVIECKSTGYNPKMLNKWSKTISHLKPVSSGVARMVAGYAIGLTNPTQARTRPIRILASIRTAKQKVTIDNWMEKLGDSFDFMICEQLEASGETRFVKRMNHEGKSLAWWGNELNCYQQSRVDDNQSLALQVMKTNDIARYRKGDERNDQSDESWLKDQTGLDFVGKPIKYTDSITKQVEETIDYQLTNNLSELDIPGNPIISLNLQLNQLLMLMNNPMLFPHFAYASSFKKAIKAMEERENRKSNNGKKKKNNKNGG